MRDDRRIRATDVSANLTLVPAGEGLTYPAEMLASRMMRQLLLRWKEEYDHVLIDTPPVCLFTDAVVLGSQADATLIVVRASQTTKHALRRARDLMFRADAQIAGAVSMQWIGATKVRTTSSGIATSDRMRLRDSMTVSATRLNAPIRRTSLRVWLCCVPLSA